jgi:hypothetical protein
MGFIMVYIYIYHYIIIYLYLHNIIGFIMIYLCDTECYLHMYA